MARNALVWETPPDVLQDAVQDLGKLVQNRVGGALLDRKLAAQGWMRVNRTWSDITGNARRGLRGEIVEEGDGWTMYFVHGVEYGVFLELANAGRYAIVMPALDRFLPRIWADVKAGLTA